ncbi:unnamed protein product [Linum trigynum]|uniref:Uncharacterized protein n=1 Tax=Linum trigynum TaxID=586398 RepID=A0AAV2CJS9_9ROSI
MTSCSSTATPMSCKGFVVGRQNLNFMRLRHSTTYVATYSEIFGNLLAIRTTNFLGLRYDSGLWPNFSYDAGIIIEVFNSGDLAVQ